MMNCGLDAEIVGYRSSRDITLKFSDGTVRSGVQYQNFLKGRVRPKNIGTISKINKHLLRIGEKRTMNCGMSAKIIDYMNQGNITVEFSDGSVRSGVQYKNFVAGSVLPQSSYKRNTPNYLGEVRTMSCGECAKIIKYKNYSDITIRFDDGTVVENVMYSCFKKGLVAKKGCVLNAYSVK